MDYLTINQTAWDKRTKIHFGSQFYDVAGFKAGNSSLNPLEIAQLGEVSGRSLLHLQCHFGLDTLSWARLGAKVTGVDLSGQAIAQARQLAEELDIAAQFIESDIYQFGKHNSTKFDIVFSSYGVLCWLPDLDRWAQTIAKALNSGGEFHLIETHPITDLLSGYSYFDKASADIEQEGTYTENCDGEQQTIVTWSHSISAVVNALTQVGLIINSLHESPYHPYPCFDQLEYVSDKGYQRLHQGQQVPLIYAIKAIKP